MSQELLLECELFIQTFHNNETLKSIDVNELKNKFIEFFLLNRVPKKREISNKNNNSENILPLKHKEPVEISKEAKYIINSFYNLLSQKEMDELPYNLRQDQMRFEQENLESLSVENAVDKYSQLLFDLIKSGKSTNLKPEQRLMADWYRPLVQYIKTEKLAISAGRKQIDRGIYGPCLLLLEDEKLAVITMHEILNLTLLRSGYKINVAECALTVGDAVLAEIRIEELRRGTNNKKLVSPQEVKKVASQEKVKLTDWDRSLKAKLGAFLTQGLLKTAKVPVKDGLKETLEPAFTHNYSYHEWPRRIGVIETNPNLLNILKRGHTLAATMSPKWLPMVHPPRLWTSYDEGGYLKHKNPIMRTRGHRSQVDALKRADLSQIYDSLNCLGLVQWKINIPVLNLINRLWEDGAGFGEIPTLKDASTASDPGKESLTSKQAARIKRSNYNLHSLRMSLKYRIEVAEMLKDKIFYMPYNVDFRGRSYPIPPHLNHLGSDVARSLMIFGRGKPLGKNGLYWLKIHLANLFGKDKLNLYNRSLWADENLSKIIASAENPYSGDRWWASTDKPFEALSACIDIAGAIKSGKPEEFISYLPVHMDGSCNGLQHYAALGRDQWGGSQVNLTASDIPQDVYMAVCNEVNRKIETDATSDNIEIKNIAKLIKGHVGRKVVKQTVMTSVYGVTMIGARDQIKARLVELQGIKWPTKNDDGGEYARGVAATYIAKLVFKSLGSVFKGAWGIMEWLTECASLIASAGQPVSWITPMGLPVVQPYRSIGTYTVKTVMQSVNLADHSDLLPVSVIKQRTAFPPNFVHSLDSTHMLMTAIDCHNKGLDFASVHDSYWTHAGDIDVMNDSLRNQFVLMHSQPILEELRTSFQSRFPSLKFPDIPARGDLNLNDVLKSKYFFD